MAQWVYLAVLTMYRVERKKKERKCWLTKAELEEQLWAARQRLVGH